MAISYAQATDAAQARHLDVLGGFHGAAQDGFDGTLILLGPLEPGFWPQFQGSPEYRDGNADPLDRWSQRVVGGLAAELGAQALFPFGGPPYQPFIDWARRSGRAWVSPVGLLVHDSAGLMVSFRGALILRGRVDLPPLPDCPCDTCAGQPCRSACPVDAMANSSYDLAACHGYLDSGPGRACLTGGCAVRRACPVSQRHGRRPEQSAFHMKAFHP